MNNSMTKNLTLDSREVAQMIEKNHAHLLREIETYKGYFIESKIGFNEFWQESTYKDSIGRTLKNYQITRKGCEFIAHKLTGRKGAVFTANYINKFHEMEEQLKNPQPHQLTRKTYKGEPVMTTLDIANLIGMVQGSVGYRIRKFNLPFRFLEGVALKEYKRENNISDSSSSELIIVTKPTVIELLKHLKAYTNAIKTKIDEYFALVPLTKPMQAIANPKELIATKTTPKLYTDTPDNKKICEQIDRVRSFMDTLDLLLYQYKRHLKQEHADAYRQVMSLVGAELYNEVLDLSIMKPQLKELPGY